MGCKSHFLLYTALPFARALRMLRNLLAIHQYKPSPRNCERPKDLDQLQTTRL